VTIGASKRVTKLVILAYIVLVSSACYLLILRGLQAAPPLAFGGVRTLLGGTSLLLIARLSGQPFIPAKKLWKWTPLVALTATTLTFGSMFLSPSFAGAGLASILGNAQPFFIALIAFMFLDERLSRQQLIALGCGLIGILIIILPSVSSQDNLLLTGTLLALTTSLAAAIGTVLGRHLKLAGSLLAFSGWQLIVGGAVLLLISVGISEPSIQWSAKFLAILVLLGIFNSAVITCAWFWLLQKEQAGSLGIFLLLIPVLGVLWALLFRGEQPQPNTILGGLLILGAVFYQEYWNYKYLIA
jgi:drug/metabolite transporter (DMT)-like permease